MVLVMVLKGIGYGFLWSWLGVCGLVRKVTWKLFGLERGLAMAWFGNCLVWERDLAMVWFGNSWVWKAACITNLNSSSVDWDHPAQQ